MIICFFMFFFFQAEDGIRDRNVTGVQTCALPIYKRKFRFFQAFGGAYAPRFAARVFRAEPYLRAKQIGRASCRERV